MSQAPGTVASWWNQNNTDQNDVKCHTPDPTKYHLPEGKQAGRDSAGVMGAIIPRARGDGSSRGFDPHRAGPILVDPNSKFGDGVVLDPNNLTNERIQQALAAVGNNVGQGRDTDNEVWAVMTMLSKPIKEAADTEMLPEYLVSSTPGTTYQPPPVFMSGNPLMPNTYVVPASNLNGQQAPTAGQPQNYQQIRQTFAQNRARMQKQAAPQPAQQPMPAPAAAPHQERPRRRLDIAPQQQQGPVMDDHPAPQPYQQPAPVQVQQFEEKEIQPEPEDQEMNQQGSYQQAPPQQAPMAPLQLDPNTALSLLQGLAQLAQQAQPQAQPVAAASPPVRRAGPVTPGRSAVPAERRVANPAQRLRPLPRNVPPPPAEGDEEVDTDWSAEQEHEAQMQENTILSLNVPWLLGAEAVKPGVQAVVQLPGYGGMSVKFHAVIEGAGCIVLVYDTRYEAGQQWVPPETGQTPFTMTLPKTKKQFQVCSMGLQFNIGVLDFVVLVVPKDEEEANQHSGSADE